jgi:hypothetical protein
MEYLIIFLLPIIGGVIWAQVQYKKNTAIADDNKERFKQILNEKNLPFDQILFTEADNGRNCLSINEKNKKVSVGKIIYTEFRFEDYDFSDIVDFEVQVDDKKTGSLSVGGAVVGGILAGGVGAIIGGTTGKGKTKVKNMNLHITVNSISNPLIKFPILRPSVDGKGYDSESIAIQNAVKTAEQWTGIFKVILNSK